MTSIILTNRTEKSQNIPNQENLARLSAAIEQCRICSIQGFVALPRPMDRGKGLRRVLLIGQAPGNGEAVRKIAFGGPAGRKLMSWFESIGLPEEKVRQYFYLSAVSKCYPGRAPKGGGDRTPGSVERLNCRPFLLQELLLVNPGIIILVGGTAIKELYGEKIKLAQIIGCTREMEIGEIHRRLAERLNLKSRADLIASFPTGFDQTKIVQIFHLPHPSGASTWLNSLENKALLEQALLKLKLGLSDL